jgi:glucose-1-phosphatase
MRTPVLIFDFGNVIAFFDYMKVWNRLGARLGRSGEDVRKQLVEHGFETLHAGFEAGEMPPVTFAQSVMAALGMSLPFEEFVRDWEDIFWPNEPVARLIAALESRGYTLILGSNTNCLHANHYRRQFASTLERFDALVLSYEVGCLKPDRRFYQACTRAAGASAASCVFIDDVAENVRGARAAGLQSLQYVDISGLTADLRRVGAHVSGGEG